MASRGSAPKPETGIADWASKIREMQRQVDADEETEQRRLEEEIAASRLKRMSRRSQVTGNPSTSLDLSKSKEFSSAMDKPDSTSNEEPKSPSARQTAQSDALQKLSSNGTHVSNEVSGSSLPQWSGAPPQSRSEPISLAAFMGGRATGPRLNRHAPQQDAHDPTKFDPRSVVNIQNTPHPIFGRGGVGLPGMSSSVKSSPNQPSSGSIPVSDSPKPPPISPKPTILREKASYPQISALPKSVPSSVSPSMTPPQKYTSTYMSQLASPKQLVQEPVISSFSTMPEPKASQAVSPPSTPTKAPTTFTSPSTPPRKPTTTTTPTIIRPVLAAQKSSPQGPLVSLSKSLSPAFQRGSAPKDLTPSLSRLQGRGFVQNMVSASSRLGGPSTPESSPTQRPSSAGRKSSVLDRWQPNVSPNPAAEAAPPASPRSIRKSWTTDNTQPPSPTKRIGTERPILKSSTSAKDLSKGLATPVKLPAMGDATQSSPGFSTKPLFAQESSRTFTPPVKLPGMADPALSSPGLGSKSTLVVMQPAHAESMPSLRSVPTTDEFGAKLSRPAIAQPSPGKPLVHPTRDRARPARNKGKALSSVPPPSESSPLPELIPAKALAIETVSIDESKEPIVPKLPPEQPSVASLAERLGDQSIIGVKTNGSNHSLAQPKPISTGGMVGQVVSLPSLATPSTLLSVETSPLTSPQTLEPASREASGIGMGAPPREKSPGNARHSRIPSTGNRARIMDVAQAMHEHVESTPPTSPVPDSPGRTEELLTPSRLRNKVVSPERRWSNFEQSTSLFPLKEEATPLPTPAGTISRVPGEQTIAAGAPAHIVRVDTSPEPIVAQTVTETEEPEHVPDDIPNEPLPHYDLHDLLNASMSIKGADPTTNTISVEVLLIVGTSASPIEDSKANIFFDSEVLAIVRRYKSKASGLVGTTVWGWVGKKTSCDEMEKNKLDELAKRYGTSAVYVNQGSEPLDMLSYLKQPLSIRQGSRTHWSPENTAMHSAREIARGIVVLDEHDFHIKNLCSGFSFCVSLLNTQYVWHGKGSKQSEQEAALQLAKKLASDLDGVVELQEGEFDPDDMFWMMLGEEEFAAAQYWSWRPQHTDPHPRCYIVDPTQSQHPISLLDDSSWNFSSSSVYLVDCIWEFFVIIGRDARLDRRAIRIAIAVAKDLSHQVAPNRPFSPPVHIIALPSSLPLDLRLALRNFDESVINEGDVPEHMNLLQWQDALSLMSTKAWEHPIWATTMSNLFI